MSMFPKEKQIAQSLHFHHLLQGFLRQVGFGHLLRDIVSSRRVTSGTSVLHYVPPLNQTHNNLHEVDKLSKPVYPSFFLVSSPLANAVVATPVSLVRLLRQGDIGPR